MNGEFTSKMNLPQRQDGMRNYSVSKEQLDMIRLVGGNSHDLIRWQTVDFKELATFFIPVNPETLNSNKFVQVGIDSLKERNVLDMSKERKLNLTQKEEVE